MSYLALQGGDPPFQVAPELLSVLRRVEPKGTGNVAHKIHQDLGRIFQYAIATGRAERNPAADLKPNFFGGSNLTYW
jgi:hypothetical protein